MSLYLSAWTLPHNHEQELKAGNPCTLPECECNYCSINEGCRGAVAALARYVLLKCPDKADFRGRAVDCAIQLTAGMPLRDRNDFVIFATRLSRTAKVGAGYLLPL